MAKPKKFEQVPLINMSSNQNTTLSDVDFWKRVFNSNSSQGTASNASNSNHANEVPIATREKQSYLAYKEIISRAFLILYHGSDITMNGHAITDQHPIAHYLSPECDLRFDLNGLKDDHQRQLFWNQLIGPAALQHARIDATQSFGGRLKTTWNSMKSIFSSNISFDGEFNKQQSFSVVLDKNTKQLTVSLNPTQPIPKVKQVCVVKVGPKALAVLEAHPQGITQEKLGLPPYSSTLTSSSSNIRPGSDSAANKMARRIRSTTPAPSPVLIKLDKFFDINNTKMTMKGLENLFPDTTQSDKAQFEVKQATDDILEVVIWPNSKNPINMQFSPTAGIYFSSLPPDQDISREALEAAMSVLFYVVTGGKNPPNSAFINHIISHLDGSVNKGTDIQPRPCDAKTQQFILTSLNEMKSKAIQNETLNPNPNASTSSQINIDNMPKPDAIWASKSHAEFSSRSTHEERKALTEGIKQEFMDPQGNIKSFSNYLNGKDYIIYNDVSADYRKENPIVERARAFVQASELWLTTNLNMDPAFVRGAAANQLRQRINELFLEFEAQSVYLPNDNDVQHQALEHFLGKLTYLLNLQTKFKDNPKLNKKSEEKILDKLYKELRLAESLMVWQRGREEILVTRINGDGSFVIPSKAKNADGSTANADPENKAKKYTSLHIEYPISEITKAQHDDLAKMYDPNPKNQPKWFAHEKLPAFARRFLRETFAVDPQNPNQIVGFEEAQKRFKSMPSTLKHLIGVSNFSESHLLVFDENKQIVSQSAEYRSSSLSPNEVPSVAIQKEVAEKNAYQLYLGKERKRALDLRDEYRASKGISDTEIQDAVANGNSRFMAPIMLAASVLSPEFVGVKKIAEFGGRVVKFFTKKETELGAKAINLHMIEVKDAGLNALRQQDPITNINKLQEKQGQDIHDIIDLQSSNHIINSLRHYPRALIRNMSIDARKNSVNYLERVAFFADFYNKRYQNNQLQNAGANTAPLLGLQTKLEEIKKQLEDHQGLRVSLGKLKREKDYYLYNITDTFQNKGYAYWKKELDSIVTDFPISSAARYQDAFRHNNESPAVGIARAKDYFIQVHALIEYIKITNLVKETEPGVLSSLFGAEDKNPNLYRSGLEHLLVRKDHGRAHDACKSGKDRTGVEELMANAMEKFCALHGYVPRYENNKDWNILMDYAADEFISMHHQKIASINSPGSEGLKGVAEMLPESLKKRVMAKVMKMEAERRNTNVDELKKVENCGKLFFKRNKLNADLNKPTPNFSSAAELRQIETEVKSHLKTAESKSHDEYLLDQIINPELAELLRQSFADQITPSSRVFDLELIDKLNEAIFDPNVDHNEFKARLENIGLDDSQISSLIVANKNIASNLLNSTEHDAALLTRIWQFSRRAPQVFKSEEINNNNNNNNASSSSSSNAKSIVKNKDYAALLDVGSLQQLVERKGIQGIESNNKVMTNPYVLPTVERRVTNPPEVTSQSHMRLSH